MNFRYTLKVFYCCWIQGAEVLDEFFFADDMAKGAPTEEDAKKV